MAKIIKVVKKMIELTKYKINQKSGEVAGKVAAKVVTKAMDNKLKQTKKEKDDNK